jgi:hypothetical protein
MSQPPDQPDFLDPAVDVEERFALLATAARLETGRPLPAPGFRGGLRRRLLHERSRRPQLARGRARLLVLAYGGSGVVLLGVAAVGLAGVGPFAAG